LFKTSFFSTQSLFILFLGLAGLLLPVALQAQLRGKVVYKKSGEPANLATVKLVSGTSSSIYLTDRFGNFVFSQKDAEKADSVIITVVGYRAIQMPIARALKISQYELTEYITELETVKVKFSSTDVVGDKKETTGFFRSWNVPKPGGEIGRILYIPYDEYKLDKIRFKVNNRCDTCIVRLHIRELAFGWPGKEILTDSIVTPVKRLATIDDKATEFDLSKYDLTFHKRNIFVSFELVSCKRQDPKEFCSFAFAGTEQGDYIYKSTLTDEWSWFNDYTIFIRASIRY